MFVKEIDNENCGKTMAYKFTAKACKLSQIFCIEFVVELLGHDCAPSISVWYFNVFISVISCCMLIIAAVAY